MEIVSRLAVLNYSLEVLDTPYESPDGETFEKTVKIFFFDHLGKRADMMMYGFMDKYKVYELIKTEGKINISHSYVKDFSLAEYRKLNGIPEMTEIPLNVFTAKECFFDCDVRVDFTYARFLGRRTNFEKAIFGNGTVDFSNCNFAEGNINFKKTRFGDGKIVFNDSVFGGGDVSFQDAMFGEGDLYCVNTNFGSGKVDFKGANFGHGQVDFKYAKFGNGDTSFERSVFGAGKKDFKAVEFGGGRIDFRRVSFGDGDISFEGAEFGNGKVMFRLAEFGHGEKSFDLVDFGEGETSFEMCEFGTGKVSFKDAKVSDIVFKDTQLNCYLDMRFEKANSIDLSDTIVRDIMDFKASESHGVQIKLLNMNGMKLMGKIFIDWYDNHVMELIYGQQKTSLMQKAEQFRILKENFNGNGDYNYEDHAYIEFKRCETKAILEMELAKGKKNAIIAYPNYYFKVLVFDHVGRYATDPIRVLRSMFFFYLTYSSLYWILPKISKDIFGFINTGLTEADTFFTAYYYSIITFLTIGYGDYYPAGFLRVLAGVEGFCGVFLMSYFTVAFVRKILR